MSVELHVLLWLVVLLALSGGTYALVRLRRRREGRRALPLPAPPPAVPRPRPEVARYPVVLAHGWMGFDTIAFAGFREDYFRGVKAHLEACGHRVHAARVAPIAGVKRRAEQLAERILALDAERVNIVAHSMGGLDARYAISQLGLSDRVASLTTVGTPHRGTPLANSTLLLEKLGMARRMLGPLGAELDGFTDLSTERMARFNQTIVDSPEVFYASYVGWVPRESPTIHALLLPGFHYLGRMVGDNDGIVPAESQRWGAVVGEVQADHWAQIGWSRGLDVKRFYAALVRKLAYEGF